ncbi:MAG: S8 family serine peptidase [bacterium]|nr:S8 family serine peptidase [bacterium]
MSFLRIDRRQRRRNNRTRHVNLELLEFRRVLNADFGIDNSDSSWLSLQPDQYDSDSILVRFRQEVRCVAESRSHGLGHDILPGTKAGPMSHFIPGLATVELGDGVSVEDALAVYQRHPDVLYAEPNYRIQIQAIPNDPSFTDLWGLNNTGQTAGVADADIDATEAWDIATGRGNTIIAVIDTGVDYTHPDLQANMWVNDLELNGIPNFDDDNNGYADDIYGYDFANNDPDPMDDHDHGTHVAGTIGAVGDNSLGITGVNWDIQIMAIKFLRADGSGDLGAAIAAIDYAVANGATISNNSWGFNGSFSPGLYDAIRNAQDAGHIFVAAAGNGNSFGVGQNNDVAPFYPAAYDLENIVSVAALDHEDQLASFSNYGAVSVDLGAPGVNILSTTIGNTYSFFNGTSMATPHVAGTLALVKDTYPDWTQAQLMAAVMETVDPVSDLQGRSITGGRLNAYQALNFSGPEIQVRHNAKQITDGSGTVLFPDTLPGVPVRETITVQNVGLDDLILDPAISLPNGYSLVTSFADTILAPGESTTFEVALNAQQLGNYTGQISFGNNDANEGIFNFNVAGKVSNVLKLDDGDVGFFTTGQWTPWLNQGLNNDITFSNAGNGSDVATWDFDVLPGRYKVAATWSILSNRATDAPYTVYDGNSVQGTVRVNQELVPNDFQDFGVGWKQLGEFTVAGGSLRVQLSDDANEFVIADGIRIEKVADLPPGPEIEIRHRGIVVDDEQSTVDFGSAFFESVLSEELVIRNVGTESLEVTSVVVPEGFSLVSPPPTYSIAPGNSVTISIAVDTTELKFRQGEISILSNDSDESTHNFTLQADVIASSIVDNGQPGFSASGEWTHWLGEGLDGDMHYSASGIGNDTATWTFALTPGEYSVAASWTTLSNRASNAPFSIYDGDSFLSSVTVNQKVAPDDFVEQGVGWEQLGQFSITSDTLNVVLSDAANGYVIADAIRIQRLDLPPAPEIELSVNGQVLEDGVGVFDFGSTVVSGTLRQSFTVTNRGEQELLLQLPIETSGGFNVSSPFGSTTLAAGESTSFEIEFQAAQAGNFNGSLTFSSNDNDEAQYDISLLASASNVLRIDNGDTGFATSGSWINYLYAGYQSDFHYSSKGTGNDQASWTFQVAPGEYQLAATWTTNPNRATNSPFTILDGGSVLSSVAINQELPPNDFSADGASWERLGTVLVTGDSVTVLLTDDANDYVIADAVRLERLGDLPSTPEIIVQWDGVALEDDVSTIDFGSTAYGVAVERSLTVKNAGGGNLQLDPNLELPAGFSLSGPLSNTNLGPGESTSFTIQLDGLLLGTASGQLILGNNDSDESPFNVTLVGEVTSVEIIDNGEPGFQSSGEWTHWQLEGFRGDMHYSTSGVGNDTASWTFAVTPGDYSVAASWTTLANRATNAPFSIYDGGTLLNTVLINQELAPNDFVEQGVGWEQLGLNQATADFDFDRLAGENFGRPVAQLAVCSF